MTTSHIDGVTGLLEQGTVFRLALPQNLLSSLLQGDISRHFRRADSLSGGVANRRDRQRHIEQNPVLPLAHGFEMIDALAPPNATQNIVLFCPPVLGA